MRPTRLFTLALAATLLAGCAGEEATEGPGEADTGDGPSGASVTPAPTATPATTSEAAPSPPVATPTPAEPTPADPTPAEPTPSPEPVEIALSGSGQSVTDEFTTTASLARFHMTHTGSSNFAIWIMDAQTGQREELAVNEIGSYDGSRYFPLDPGTYVLDVTADGEWTVTIAQPQPASGRTVPTELSGEGDTAVEPLELPSGLRRFAMSHDGSSNFAVWLLDADGDRVELLANEIGAWEGEKAVGIAREGVHFLDVSADGAWTISVR